MRGDKRGGALLTSPLFVASVGLLLLNDHVLKQARPGLVTGKLSDVAGVVMVALVLTAVTRRPLLALGGTAVSFAVLKTVPAAAVWASPVLGGVTRTDPTDLVALLALVPVGWWLIRPRAHAMPVAFRPHETSWSTWWSTSWSTSFRVVMIGMAVVATTATSSDVDQATIALVDGDAIAWDGQDAFRSTDGGLSWRRVQGPALTDTSESGALDEVCVPGGCFSIAERRIRQVGESGDLVLPADYLGTSGEGPASAPTGIVAVPGDGGSTVVVWHPGDGALHRSVDGEWSWRPQSTFERRLAFDWSGTGWLIVMLVAPLMIVASGPAAFRTAALGSLDPTGTRTLVMASGILMLFMAVGLVVITGSELFSGLRPFVAATELLITLPVSVWSWSYRWRTPKPPPRPIGMSPPDPWTRVG